MAKVRLLFVCVENSCRSQMAEGFARQYGGEAVDVHSAGSAPSGKVSPHAVELMRERDIDIDGQPDRTVSGSSHSADENELHAALDQRTKQALEISHAVSSLPGPLAAGLLQTLPVPSACGCALPA